MSEEAIPNYREVTVSVSMSKSFMIEIPEDATHEELIEKAKSEIVLPNQSLDIARQILKQFGIKVYGREFEDWYVDEVEYIHD